MKITGILVASALGAVSTIGAASAASISFNSAYNRPQQGPIAFSNGSETVSVSAARVDGAGNVIPGTALISSYGSSQGGLGICTSGYDLYGTGGCDGYSYRGEQIYDEHLIDGDASGNGAAEMAFIDFGELMVKLVSITFNYVDAYDDFDLKVDGNAIENNLGLTNRGSADTYTFDLPRVGSVFGIGANHSSDQFKIESVSYDVIPSVPLPGAGLMLVGALAGIGMIRRRRAK